MKKLGRVILVALFCAACVMLLSACSKYHQVIPNKEDCVKCHSEAKPIVDVSNPAGALISNDGVINVTVSGNEGFSVCQVIFTKDDGSHFVPYSPMHRTAKAGETVQVKLDQGTWAICAGKDETPTSQIIVVDPSATSNFDGNLSLKG